MAEEIALTHHERWDGGGYPTGLAGEAIPITGRIVAVADVFDALTHVRPYKPAWSADDAVAEMQRESARHFDPQVLDAFLGARLEPSSRLREGLIRVSVCGRAQPVRAASGPARADAVSLHGQAAASARQGAAQAGRVLAQGCPVGLDGLRLLTVRHWGWDGRAHNGQLIVNARAAQPLRRVFRSLYGLHFPIRHMQLDDFYGPKREGPNDVTASFECRQAVPSPCTGGKGTGTWSQHAYGLAVDVNPVRSLRRLRPEPGPDAAEVPQPVPAPEGHGHPRAIQAFSSIGWGWGGAWAGTPRTTCTSPRPAVSRSC